MTAECADWINSHGWTILGAGFCFFTAVFQLSMATVRLNVLKLVVLSGTFALVMAFAANDLVNFIGLPWRVFTRFPWRARPTIH